MHDEAAIGIQLTNGVQSAHEVAIRRNALQSGASDARHDRHIQHNVGAVRNLDAAARQRRVDRAHAVGDDVQGPLMHTATEQVPHLDVSFLRIHPMIVRAGVVLGARADVGQMLDAGDVAGVRAGEMAAGEEVLVESLKLPVAQQLRGQVANLLVGAVAPMHGTRLRQFPDRTDPLSDGAADLGQRGQHVRGSGHPRILLFQYPKVYPRRART